MKAFSEETGLDGCPPEDAVEGWAIQDVMGKEDMGERIHLGNCRACREKHREFVDFYRILHDETRRFFVAKVGGEIPSRSLDYPPIRPTFQAMRPLDPSDRITPVAFSHTLLSDHWTRASKERPFISSDGTVYGKFLASRDGGGWAFQLMSPDLRFVRRALISLPEEEALFQSDELGSVALCPWSGSPDEVGIIEVIPHVSEAAYAVTTVSEGEELPVCVALDGGAIGKIMTEQEEGEEGESILHVVLSELPNRYLQRRVFVAFADGYHRPLVDESIGRDVYLYGPELFRDFQLWFYIR